MRRFRPVLDTLEERYLRPIAHAAKLERLLDDPLFLADPINHPALFSDHGPIHVRDVAACYRDLAETANGLLISRRPPERLSSWSPTVCSRHTCTTSACSTSLQLGGGSTRSTPHTRCSQPAGSDRLHPRLRRTARAAAAGGPGSGAPSRPVPCRPPRAAQPHSRSQQVARPRVFARRQGCVAESGRARRADRPRDAPGRGPGALR